MSFGCFVIYNKEGKQSRVYLWETPFQREQWRTRAVQLAMNMNQPATVEEFIGQPHTGTQVWPTQGESK